MTETEPDEPTGASQDVLNSREVSRAEFEALQERVEELESMLAEQRRYEDSGLDHRDATVLDQLDVGGEYHPRALVKLYVRLTDITNPRTAKQRAKTLTSRSFFERSGEYLVFRGADDE